MDLAILLRLSVIEVEMHDLARHLLDARENIIRHAARILRLRMAGARNDAGVQQGAPANDNAGAVRGGD